LSGFIGNVPGLQTRLDNPPDALDPKDDSREKDKTRAGWPGDLGSVGKRTIERKRRQVEGLGTEIA